MKLKIFINLILINILFGLYSNKSFSQYCNNTIDYCNQEDLGDFNYSSQSVFASLSPGDTARVKIVTYAGKQYRVLVCNDPSLLEIRFKIIKLIRKENKTYTIKYGDTVWTYNESFEEKEIFDSKTKSYWESNITESGRLFVDIYVPPSVDGKNSNADCVGVFVGSKLIRNKTNKGKSFNNYK